MISPTTITMSPKPRMHRNATTGLWITEGMGSVGLGHTQLGSWLEWLKRAAPRYYSEIVAQTLYTPDSPWHDYIPQHGCILSPAESRAGAAHYLPRRHLQLVSA